MEPTIYTERLDLTEAHLAKLNARRARVEAAQQELQRFEQFVSQKRDELKTMAERSIGALEVVGEEIAEYFAIPASEISLSFDPEGSGWSAVHRRSTPQETSPRVIDDSDSLKPEPA